MGTIGLSENDYQEFLNWWNAGGGAGIGGRPANNDALWSNPKFIEWIFTQKFATLPWKKSLPNAPEIKQYLADAYENWSGTPAHIANLRLTYSHLPNVLTGAERVSALPGWSKYELNMIQTEGEDVGGYTLYKNQLYSTKGTTARPLTPEESNRILKKFYGEDTLARERFEFEKEQAAKGELATGRRTLWDIEQAAKTETRAAREAELSAAERAENRAWQREQTASTRAFQQAQLGVQERQQYAAMKARPSNWIQAWYYEHMPQLQSLPPIQRRAVEGMRLLSEQQPYLEPIGGIWAIPPQYAGFCGEPRPTTVVS